MGNAPFAGHRGGMQTTNPTTSRELMYTAGDIQCRGFLAEPGEMQGKRPGIIVVHEAFGLGEHAKMKATRLAELGYVALAADMYGDGREAGSLEEAMGIMGPLTQDPPTWHKRMQGAYDALTALPNVDATKIGAIGFCFGGTTVLEFARTGAPLAGVVSFHGGLTFPESTSGKPKAKMLVCTGADDPFIPSDAVFKFEDLMRAAGADYQVISYSGTKHSFTNPKASEAGNDALVYNPQTDTRSWTAMQAFFDEVFA